ncbi:hypothetical protein ACN47E_004115 [Coniothyrium glycines]
MVGIWKVWVNGRSRYEFWKPYIVQFHDIRTGARRTMNVSWLEMELDSTVNLSNMWPQLRVLAQFAVINFDISYYLYPISRPGDKRPSQLYKCGRMDIWLSFKAIGAPAEYPCPVPDLDSVHGTRVALIVTRSHKW